jgi:hypothetical protein
VARVNLLADRNGSFEAPDYGLAENEFAADWTLTGGAEALYQALSPGPIPDGVACGQLQVTSGSSNQGISIEVAVKAGTTVDLSLASHLDSFGSPSFEVELSRPDTSTTLYAVSLAGSDAWAEHAHSNIAVGVGSSNAVTVRLTIILDVAGSATTEAWLDAIELVGEVPDDSGPPPTVPPPRGCPPGPAHYSLWLRSPTGAYLALLDTLISFSYTRVVCGIGTFTVLLPGFPAGLSDIEENSIVEIWRGIGPEEERLVFVGFVEVLRRVLVEVAYGPGPDESSLVENLELRGCDPNGLLNRRVIPYLAETAEGDLGPDPIDDLMKSVVRLAMANGDDRAYPSSYFSVEADAGAGPEAERTVALRPVWDVLLELRDASREAGTEVLFDVRWNNNDAFDLEFRTTTLGYLGADLTGPDGPRLGSAFGNLSGAEYERNYQETANIVYYDYDGVVYEVGAGSSNIWGRRESYQDARSETTSDGAASIARAASAERTVRERLSATLPDTDIFRYGCAWDLGDKVRAIEFGRTWDAMIWAVTVTMSENNVETIQAAIEAEL